MDALYQAHERYLVGIEGVKEVWLIRHGDAYGDQVALRANDQFDPPLSTAGRLQAGRLGRRLAAAGLRTLWSSDLVRARETAEIAAEQLPGAAVAVERRLREVKTHWDDGMVPPPPEDCAESDFPFLEPEDDVVARMHAAVLAIANDLEVSGQPRAAAVSHAAAIGAYVAHLLGLPYGKLPILPQYTSVSVLRVKDGRVVVQSLTDISHRLGEDEPD